MSKIITPTFGGGNQTSSGGGEPPSGPPTYDELLFKVEQQADIINHLRNMLLVQEEKYKRLDHASRLAMEYLKELINLQQANQKVHATAEQGFRDILNSFPTRR